MPKGLTREQREDLYRAAKYVVELYRNLAGPIRLGIPRNKDERESAVAEIAAFRAAVEGRQHPPRLSDEVLGWATYFAGPSAVESIERAIFEPAAALEVLQVTTAGIKSIKRAPRGRKLDHAAFGVGVGLARDWKRITGRGTSYRPKDENFIPRTHGPFSTLLRAVIRVANEAPSFQGAELAMDIHRALKQRDLNDARLRLIGILKNHSRSD